MGSRSVLFFRASELRDYVLVTNFDGLAVADAPSFAAKPDSMGAVSPDYFVQMLNVGVAVYDRVGSLIAVTNLNDFFRIGTNFPAGSMQDSRLLYDSVSNRWVACAQDQTSGQVALAVSNDRNPTDFAGGWSKYLIAGRRDGNALGLQAMGMDANGVYVDVLRYQGQTSTNAGHSVIGIKKPEIYLGNLITNSTEIPSSEGIPVWYIQPAVNSDSLQTNG